MNLIEEIRATQNRCMSNHSARMIINVFARYLAETGSAMFITSGYEEGARDKLLLLAYELSVDATE